MINANESTTRLVSALNEFLKSSYKTLEHILEGMHLAQNILSLDDKKNNLSQIIEKISKVSEMISSFKISIRNIKGSEQVCLAWGNTGSQEQYLYNEDNDLTERMFSFILMSFDREISQRLSVIEEANNGYIYFCDSIKGRLHRIITEYMTS